VLCSDAKEAIACLLFNSVLASGSTRPRAAPTEFLRQSAFLNHVRLLKNSATQIEFFVGDDHQVCYSDVQEEHIE
jgi:hypothetical protein